MVVRRGPPAVATPGAARDLRGDGGIDDLVAGASRTEEQRGR
jgi:hypothetical protein